MLLVAVAAAGYFVFKPGGDDLAKRQAAADRKVVTRLVEHFATALKGADADLLARTVSANVVRKGSDGNEPPKCVIDRGSKDAIVRWSDLWQSVADYRIGDVKVMIEGSDALMQGESRARGVPPGSIRMTAKLQDGVWRLTEVVSAPCES